jgi:hypothetical protein
MFDFPWREGAARVLRTFPFLLIRVAVYLGIAAAFVVAAGGGAGIGWAIGAIGGATGRAPGAFWGMVGGLALIGTILWWLREYLLFLVEAGHVAALVRDPATAPTYFGQVGHALSIVQQRFREVRTLHAAEQLVRGTTASLVETANIPATLLGTRVSLPPAPTSAILRSALRFMNDVVLSRPLRTASKNPWPELRDALALLAENQTALFSKAAILAILATGVVLVFFILALIPASGLAASFPGAPRAGTILLAGVFAWSFKQAVINPFLVAIMIDEFSRTTRGQSADPRVQETLALASPQYREIEARAAARKTPARHA